MVRQGLVVLAALALAGCPAAHGDYPSQSCMTNDDCFKGERCLNSSICVPADDMAIAPKRKTIDLGPDLGPDMRTP
jgi:hypothetical protein